MKPLKILILAANPLYTAKKEEINASGARDAKEAQTFFLAPLHRCAFALKILTQGHEGVKKRKVLLTSRRSLRLRALALKNS